MIHPSLVIDNMASADFLRQIQIPPLMKLYKYIFLF